MGVIKRGNSKYWYIQFQFQGNTYIQSSKTTDKRAAEQMERDWRSRLHAQTFLGLKERITLRLALDGYAQSKSGTSSYRNIIGHIRTIDGILRLDKYMDELTNANLERLKHFRSIDGIAATTIRNMFVVVRGSWKYAKRMGYQVSELIFPQVKLPRYRLRYLSFEEEKMLLGELDPRRYCKRVGPFEERSVRLQKAQQDAYDLVVLLLDTGARYGEIATLKWEQVNLDSRSINLWRQKVQNESILYMTDRVYSILLRRHQVRESGYIFTNRKGGPRGYTTESIRDAFRRAGLGDCSIHTLRHTHASRLVQNGLSVYEVKEILGHSDIHTTMRYAHLEQREISSKATDVINRLNAVNQKANLRLVK